MPPISSESSFVLLDELKQNTLEEVFDKVNELYGQEKITREEVNKITDALVTLNQVFLKQEKANFTIRQATLADVDSLMEMIEYWAKKVKTFQESVMISSVVFKPLPFV